MSNLYCKSIGGLELEDSLFVGEEYEPANILSEALMTEAVSHVVFQASIVNPLVTLLSKHSRILSKAEKDFILTLYNQEDLIVPLVYTDESTEDVKFNKEKGILFIEVYEGAEVFTAFINMVKV